MKKLYITGDIIHDDDQWIYDLLEMSATSHKKVKDFLEESGGDEIEIYINSPGGSVHAGSSIYGELRAYKGKTTAYITGIAASAASIIMLGAQKVIAIPTAQVMIHNPQTYASGDYKEMEKTAEALKSYNEAIINAYELKTKLDRAKLQELMDNSTYMSAQKAQEYGFIDEIALKDGETLTNIKNAVASLGGVKNLVQGTLNTAKLRELLKKPNDNGGKSQPVADITQRDTYLAKKYEKMEVLSK